MMGNCCDRNKDGDAEYVPVDGAQKGAEPTEKDRWAKQKAADAAFARQETYSNSAPGKVPGDHRLGAVCLGP